MSIYMSDDERVEKLRDLLKRMERSLGEENLVSLRTLNEFGCELDDNGEYEEAREVHDRYAKDYDEYAHIYDALENYGKVEELYERSLEGYEAQFGRDQKMTKMCSKYFSTCSNNSGNVDRLAELITSYPGLYHPSYPCLAFEEVDKN
ncbi:hypothetical protein TrLO_g12584 [Triparma laevis f. longispina]|uniref:Uncharacterized protein n=1 Tax=Triparma laevis f. longispina TaxID=1714387 RepID=A0A9W7CGY9_9STRA|nr:hypothetical protein TrLO_g12584 [Triparma laevis f. longispina]